MGLRLTSHAVERFIGRWRPGTSNKEALAELQMVAELAAPTRQRTLLGDAQLYVATTPAGERIRMAVREGTIITVLPEFGEGQDPIDLSAESEYIQESEETKAACRAMLAAEAPLRAKEADDRMKMGTLERLDAERRQNAIRVISEHRSFTRRVNPPALARAHKLLGINEDDPLPES
jgi:hypothetical protein